MPDPDDLLEVAREWAVKADNDLKTAAHTLELGDECPTDTVCYHAQQCVEKYLKAVLVVAGVDFPKTHDLEKLTTLVPADARPQFSVEEQARLTDYATAARYPGWDDVSLAEARRAVAVARRVRREVRRRLPRKVLFRRRPANR